MKREKKPKKKLLIVIILTFLFCTIGVGIYTGITAGLFSRPAKSSTADSPIQLQENGSAVDGAAQSKTSEEVLKNLQKAQINVTDKLSSSILFPNGKAGAVGSWTVENLKTNNVIMQCEVIVDDKLIARSVPIKPDQHIENITLLEDVKSGQYDVIAYINYFSLDTNKYISKAGFKIKLTVQ